ncbi:hypothetical protein BGZ60DRAFT_529208 [Tricladium varicosporioides]|nr:hypothetical protein BGZ60DRAFT_529208 [Hymenoscyphus varicosporioides]
MAPKPRPLRLGILVPSSNTTLEPLTAAIITSINNSLPETSRKLTVHFTRIPVTSISFSSSAIKQFDIPTLLAAAKLLSHAGVDIIGWSGTSSGWLGFGHDEELCSEIERETGVPATSSILGLNKALLFCNPHIVGLVTPYRDDIQAAIVKNYAKIGIDLEERHLSIERTKAIAEVGEEVLDGMVEELVVQKGVDVVTTFCTNLVAAQRVEVWEEMWGVPVLDTVTTVIWDMCRQLKIDTHNVEGWGSIFRI